MTRKKKVDEINISDVVFGNSYNSDEQNPQVLFRYSGKEFFPEAIRYIDFSIEGVKHTMWLYLKENEWIPNHIDIKGGCDTCGYIRCTCYKSVLKEIYEEITNVYE